MPSPTLIVTADDYGYAPAYDRGILEAASAGAVDAVSAMPGRGGDATSLLETGVGIGLHLEAEKGSVEAQLERFRALFEREPAYLDGHHHCHAQGELRREAIVAARELGVAVRSVDASHRRELRAAGVPTPDLLVGRLFESAAALPAEIDALAQGRPVSAEIIEWVVHPGHPDPTSGSSYDTGRAEDLRLVLGLSEALGPYRRRHEAAFA